MPEAKYNNLTSASYYLSTSFSLCEVDGALVVLNHSTRRYSSLPRQYAEALSLASEEWNAGRTPIELESHSYSEARRHLEQLLHTGLVTRDASSGKPIRRIPATAKDAIDFGWGDEELEPVRLSHCLLLVVAVARAVLKLKCIPFERLLKDTMNRRSRLGATRDGTELARAERLARIFRNARVLAYSSHEECLFDSLVLVEFFALHSMYPHWFIGVKSKPFRAHSWVQYEHCVLNGTVEHVEQFTPIHIA